MPRARPVSSKNSSCACACGAGGDKEAERHIQSMHYGHLRYGRDGRRLRTRTHFHRTAKHLQDTERGQGCTYVATERLVINHTERLAPRNKPSLPNNSSKRRLIAPPPLNKLVAEQRGYAGAPRQAELVREPPRCRRRRASGSAPRSCTCARERPGCARRRARGPGGSPQPPPPSPHPLQADDAPESLRGRLARGCAKPLPDGVKRGDVGGSARGWVWKGDETGYAPMGTSYGALAGSGVETT